MGLIVIVGPKEGTALVLLWVILRVGSVMFIVALLLLLVVVGVIAIIDQKSSNPMIVSRVLGDKIALLMLPKIRS